MMNNNELLKAAELLVTVGAPLGALLAFEELTLQRDVTAPIWRRCAALLDAARVRSLADGLPAGPYADRAADCRLSADWIERTSPRTLQWIPVVDTRPRADYRLPDGSIVKVVCDHGEIAPATITYSVDGAIVMAVRA
jgi:hypothetical protein